MDNSMEDEVKRVMKGVLPDTFNIIIRKRKSCFGNDYLAIGASPSTYEINGVRGQFPQLVSLCLDLETLELKPQIFGCMGGQSFSRNICPDLFPDEKYLAQSSVKVPFRKPKMERIAVLNAISRFFTRYLLLLIEWRDDLQYKEFGNYEFLNIPRCNLCGDTESLNERCSDEYTCSSCLSD